MKNEKIPTSKYIITHLDKKHVKEKFKCGVEALDIYLKTQANQDTKKNIAVTYTLTAENSEEVLGYYTLSSIGVFPGELSEEIVKKLPRYPVLPGILLGRLAVNKNYHGKKIGVYLLLDALKRSLLVSEQIGIVAVIVDAKNDTATMFYKKHGFIELLKSQYRLFLPLATIKKLAL
jgi:GNAT superfamily N-acetyltransferase